MPEWNKGQLNAIEAQDGSVLVSAAAGSGKTSVLIERIIRMITRKENPIDVDRLLIVTFTRAAATGMKDKLTKEIDRLLAENGENKHQLLRQRQLMYNTNICTIDSFCGAIVREYFHILGIQKDFRLADENETKILSTEALDSVLDEYYTDSTEDFTNLADVFSDSKGDGKLKEAVLKIANFLATQPFPDDWLDNMLANYSTDISVEDTLFGRIVIEKAKSMAEYALSLTEKSLEILKDCDEPKLQKNIALFSDDKAYFEKLIERCGTAEWDELKRFSNTFVSGRFSAPRKKKDESEDPIVTALKNSRDKVKKLVTKIQKCFIWSSEDAENETEYLRLIVSKLFEVVREYLKKFAELKSAKNMLSFADVESLTVKLLAKPYGDGYIKTEQAKEISKRFDQVMVDEFQDVNDVQDLIFKCVSTDENNMFVVGDVKQSIYGFRQAKPEIFIERRNSYQKYDREKPVYPATIFLNENFRSRPEVCDAVNFIFAQIMSKKSANMDYTEDEYLRPGKKNYSENENCNFELDYLIPDEDDDVCENEAKFIANRILQMMSDGYCVGEDKRPLEFGDCAVLLRNTKNIAPVYVNVLNSLGVPACSEIKESFFEADEIKVILNFLRCIDNPSLDIPLLSVMCSPVYSFTVDELAKIRGNQRYTNLYSAVVKYSEQDNRTAQFLNELMSLKTYSCTCSVDELLGRIYELTSFSAIISAIKGSKGVNNLNLLREYARSFESGGYKGLSSFVTYIDKMIENGKDLEASNDLNGETRNMVKVISIHKSKGLEYPICFIANTAKGFNKTDQKDDVLIDSKAGLGIRMVDGFSRINTLARFAVGIEIDESLTAEEMRVLYVALTRPQDKLIIVASPKAKKTNRKTDVPQTPQTLFEKYITDQNEKLIGGNIDSYLAKNADRFCDWITMCALVHPENQDFWHEKGIDTQPCECEITPKPWTINIVESIAAKDTEAYTVAINDDIKSESYDESVIELLKKRTGFAYKNEAVLKIPQKVSASELAHNEGDSFDKIFLKPKFMSEADTSAVERGTAHHKFLEMCNFANAKKDLQAELDRLVENNLLAKEQADAIDKAEIARFLESNLAKRIMQSDLVMREQRFTVHINAGMLDSTLEGESAETKVVMQGAIDLIFKEDNALVVVDYKTDRVRDIERLRELYSKQLCLYKQAVEQFTDYKVKECMIYSIHLNGCVSVDC